MIFRHLILLRLRHLRPGSLVTFVTSSLGTFLTPLKISLHHRSLCLFFHGRFCLSYLDVHLWNSISQIAWYVVCITFYLNNILTSLFFQVVDRCPTPPRTPVLENSLALTSPGFLSVPSPRSSSVNHLSVLRYSRSISERKSIRSVLSVALSPDQESGTIVADEEPSKVRHVNFIVHWMFTHAMDSPDSFFSCTPYNPHRLENTSLHLTLVLYP